jgi:hypothetical protein
LSHRKIAPRLVPTLEFSIAFIRTLRRILTMNSNFIFTSNSKKVFIPKVFHTWGTNVFAFTEISFKSTTDGIFRSQLGPSLELFRCICQNIDENKSSPGGAQLCRFSFGIVRILIQKKLKGIYTKLITTCEYDEMSKKSIVSIKPI